MRLERVTDSSHPMYNEALRLYQISFPYHEQREELSQKRILGDSEYCFDLVYDEDRFVGPVARICRCGSPGASVSAIH